MVVLPADVLFSVVSGMKYDPQFTTKSRVRSSSRTLPGVLPPPPQLKPYRKLFLWGGGGRLSLQFELSDRSDHYKLESSTMTRESFQKVLC